jgi:hypothetical protein
MEELRLEIIASGRMASAEGTGGGGEQVMNRDTTGRQVP